MTGTILFCDCCIYKLPVHAQRNPKVMSGWINDHYYFVIKGKQFYCANQCGKIKRGK